MQILSAVLYSISVSDHLASRAQCHAGGGIRGYEQ